MQDVACISQQEVSAFAHSPCFMGSSTLHHLCLVFLNISRGHATARTACVHLRVPLHIVRMGRRMSIGMGLFICACVHLCMYAGGSNCTPHTHMHRRKLPRSSKQSQKSFIIIHIIKATSTFTSLQHQSSSRSSYHHHHRYHYLHHHHHHLISHHYQQHHQ